ncbi:MAG: hypothetical protein ACLP9S_13865 [Syntrophales bacterium]
MRKIDDNLLLEMFDDGKGKSQKEIAKFFGVSGAAICKRLKRLTAPSPEAPLSFSKLTEKAQAFVIEKVKGETNVQAVLNSYDVTSRESAKALGTTLMRDPDIQTAIHDLMAQEGLPKRYRIRKVKNLIDSKDGNISAKGLDMSFKLTGEYAAEKVVVGTFDYAASSLKLEALRREYAEAKQRRDELQKKIEMQAKEPGQQEEAPAVDTERKAWP